MRGAQMQQCTHGAGLSLLHISPGDKMRGFTESKEAWDVWLVQLDPMAVFVDYL